MRYSQESVKGGYMADHIGDLIGLIEGDTRSLDYSSYDADPTTIDSHRFVFLVPGCQKTLLGL